MAASWSVDLYADSPGLEAGLRPGDILTACDGVNVKSSQDILAHIASAQPGGTIKVAGLRGRETFQVSIAVRAATAQSLRRSATCPINPPGPGPMPRSRCDASPIAISCRRAIEERLQQVLTGGSGNRPVVMLSGGSTPIPAYLELAKRHLTPAPGLTVLFSDDRYVPSDSDQSNYHQSRALFTSLGLADEQVLRVRTELALQQATADSQNRLAQLLASERRITLGLLGIGADGHTCSLFSAADLERARGKLAISVHRPDGRDAVSVTPTVLERVDELIVLVAGADKRAAVAGLMDRRADLTAWNAVRGCRSVEVWADASALAP